MELRIPAVAVSRGIGIGRAVFLNGDRVTTSKADIAPARIDHEIERFRNAVSQASSELRALSANRETDSPESASGIFGVHLLILEQSSLIPNIESTIRDQYVNAEWAVRKVADDFVASQMSVADQHLRDKYLDVEDVAERMLSALGKPQTVENGESGAVFVVSELRPSRLLELAKSGPTAVISAHGGWTSHTSILARELKLPVVTGVRNIERLVSQNDEIIVDAIDGKIIINPTQKTIDHFMTITDRQMNSEKLPMDVHISTKTLDGHEIVIRANADLPHTYELAAQAGAQGIGLYRSEVIFNQFQRFPGEVEQITAYSRIADLVGDAGVRIRTFDIGVDQLEGDARTTERNPSLGLRSIRLNLTDSTQFRTQIRAILQAAHNRKIDIVLPMIAGVAEIRALREIIGTEAKNLTNSGTSIGNPRVGAMIEVPSAVLTAGQIARYVDFMCLGTNDLVQYLLAVDRDNEAVADWYQTLHPAVIIAIKDVIAVANDADIPVAVCGETAGSAFYVPLLIGLGARELSMNAGSILQIRRLIAGITLKETAQLVEVISHYETADEIEAKLRDYYLQNWRHLFPPGLLASNYP